MIMHESYRQDLLEYLDQVQDAMLKPHTRESIKNNQDNMDRLWYLYEKSITEYGCGPEWAFADAIHDVYGLDLYDYMMNNIT